MPAWPDSVEVQQQARDLHMKDAPLMSHLLLPRESHVTKPMQILVLTMAQRWSI
jgi:hypothetical protein